MVTEKRWKLIWFMYIPGVSYSLQIRLGFTIWRQRPRHSNNLKWVFLKTKSLLLTSFGAFPNAHAKPLSGQIDNCYISPSISDSCVSLLNHLSLQYVRATYLLEDKYNVLVTVGLYSKDYLVYKFWSSNRLQWTSNHMTVHRGLFGLQILIFK